MSPWVLSPVDPSEPMVVQRIFFTPDGLVCTACRQPLAVTSPAVPTYRRCRCGAALAINVRLTEEEPDDLLHAVRLRDGIRDGLPDQ